MTDKEDKNAQQQEPAPDADTHKEKDDITAQESSFNHAMKELGESMSELASARSVEALNSAIPLIKDAAERIRSQARGKSTGGFAEQADGQQVDQSEERFESAQELADMLHDHDASQLYLNDNKRVAGVCAALARYFAMDTFTVRMLAVTGLIFIPQVAFPAYWICYFMFDKRGGRLDSEGQSRRQRRKQRKRERRAMRVMARASKFADQYGSEGYGWSKAQLRKMRRRGYRGLMLPGNWFNPQQGYSVGEKNHEEQVSSVTNGVHSESTPPEAKTRAEETTRSGRNSRPKGASIAPEVMLRKARFRRQELETRLRRLESFVTSKQFYLHKELTIIEK